MMISGILLNIGFSGEVSQVGLGQKDPFKGPLQGLSRSGVLRGLRAFS